MAIWTLAKKDFRVLLRDRLATALLVAMPLLFILTLGLLLGENFGRKADDTLRLSLVSLDRGPGTLPEPTLLVAAGLCGVLAGSPASAPLDGAALATLMPDRRTYYVPEPARITRAAAAAVGVAAAPAGGWMALPLLHPGLGAYRTWADVLLADLRETPGIRLEIITDRPKAEELIRSHRRAAILVLREDFSDRVGHCSFLDTPFSVNPFHREGIYLRPDRVNLGVEFLVDPTQGSAAAIIEQVVQVSMLRVLMPYMIGQAFLKLSEPRFIDRLSEAVRLPLPADFAALVGGAKRLLADRRVQLARSIDPRLDATLREMEARLTRFEPLTQKDLVQLAEILRLAAGADPGRAEDYRNRVGNGVQAALTRQFSKYNLTGMTWAALTRSQADRPGARVSEFEDLEGGGILRRGARRYQLLVPGFTVLFTFFLVLTVGWVFVAERRQGTLKRLRTAPITRAEILLGKLLPCFVLSLGQGVFLLVAGRLLFGMRWGPDTWALPVQAGWLLLVVFSTSLAAMGLAFLVAALARTEIQVALYGAVPMLVLALIGGCVLPREMMPERTQKLTLLTPQGWALDAYRELLAGPTTYEPNLQIVLTACAVLATFGVAFLALAWALLPLD